MAATPGLIVVNDGDGIRGQTTTPGYNGVVGSTQTPSSTYYLGGAGVFGTSGDGWFGVHGAVSRSGYGYGVAGLGPTAGVYGDAVSPGGYRGIGNGVIGTSGAGGGYPGVAGISMGLQGHVAPVAGGDFGVWGEGPDGGVHGKSAAVGVWGEGAIGVYGTTTGSPMPGARFVYGVRGSSDPNNGVGVEGDSEFGTGVWGFGRAGAGVRASTDTNDPLGGGWALLTDGDVLIQGTIYAAPGFSKGALVKARDGSHRTLYCVESPECWFEDFGRARLVRGKARVRLDRTFAAVVRTGDYHVFLSPEGLSHGLYVSRRTRDGFEVREQHRGASTVTFSYRIVARRKDVDAPRFSRVQLREIPKLPARPPKPKATQARPAKVKVRRLPLLESQGFMARPRPSKPPRTRRS